MGYSVWTPQHFGEFYAPDSDQWYNICHEIWTQANKKYMMKSIYSDSSLSRNVRSKLSLDPVRSDKFKEGIDITF